MRLFGSLSVRKCIFNPLSAPLLIPPFASALSADCCSSHFYSISSSAVSVSSSRSSRDSWFSSSASSRVCSSISFS